VVNPDLGTNEKYLPIQWTELPTGVLVSAGPKGHQRSEPANRHTNPSQQNA